MSVLIPTSGRPHKLAACIAALSRQTLTRDRFEVLVGIDGAEDGELAALGSVPKNFVIHSFPKAGPAATRNRLLELARGKFLLFLSESVLPSQGLLEAHLIGQAQHCANGKPCLLMGLTPFVVYQPDRLFDKLIRERGAMCSGELLAGDQLRDPNYDWGYRHAWSINLSMPADQPRKLGGYTRQLSKGEYEDTEMAWRLQRWLGMPLRVCRDAVAQHDRRFDPMDLLKREATLGYEALQLAVLSPQCARELFGRDVNCPNEQRYTKGYLNRERGPAENGLWALMNTAHTPVAAIDPKEVASRLDRLDEAVGALKRWLWRRGLSSAHDHEPLSRLHEGVDEFVAEARKRRAQVLPSAAA